MADSVVVLMTASSAEEAASISRALVDERLVACCNVIPAIRSIYRWEGKVCDEQEVMVIAKTRASVFDRLVVRVKELHSYDVPEIIALPIAAGSESYMKWIEENVGAI